MSLNEVFLDISGIFRVFRAFAFFVTPAVREGDPQPHETP
jgi:hypothetical protein